MYLCLEVRYIINQTNRRSGITNQEESDCRQIQRDGR